ncbi:hypothetical protein FPOAC1_002272 [Fusarium poae]|uniref:hypothetical protein n=1 Tax=Fusarium poae TaxID=36050 RepID=UPI001CEBB1E3|nr:hypothetical protein FPOAC1_002272 [Fusarium poae]KAG8676270.1 hypothetical protein FPOAC1_002272 [Fusarium poae]
MLVTDIEDLGVSESPVNISNNLVVLEGGENIPQSSIFDLKTRSISQFVLAYHEKGLFRQRDIEIKDVKSDIEKWQDQNQPSLNRLAALFRIIIENTQTSNDGKLELVWSKDGSLEVRKQLPDAGDVLSEPVKKQWEAWLGVENEEKADPGKSGSWEEFMATLSDSDDQSDYAACDAECGYCGKCV